MGIELFVNIYLYEFILRSVCVRIVVSVCINQVSYGIVVNLAAEHTRVRPGRNHDFPYNSFTSSFSKLL